MYIIFYLRTCIYIYIVIVSNNFKDIKYIQFFKFYINYNYVLFSFTGNLYYSSRYLINRILQNQMYTQPFDR